MPGMVKPKHRPHGDFAYHATGQIFIPDRKISRIKNPSRYCALPLRGYSQVEAVVHKGTRRAIGFNYNDVLGEMGVRVCRGDDYVGLRGARRRRRRR